MRTFKRNIENCFWIVLFICLLHSSHGERRQNKYSIRAEEVEATDIIKKITKVNKALQELIQSNEKFQKNYKSGESFQDDYLRENDASRNADTIWEEIVKNKPIKLHNLENSAIKTEELSDVISTARKYSNQALIILISKKSDKRNLNKTENLQFLHKLDNTELSSSSSESDDKTTIVNDQIQTKVLRQAFGAACSKLVLRKCYKACKAAIKITCLVEACKKNLKRTFKRESKTGCIKFLGSKSLNEAKISNYWLQKNKKTKLNKKKNKQNNKTEEKNEDNKENKKEDDKIDRKKEDTQDEDDENDEDEEDEEKKRNKKKNSIIRFADATRQGYYDTCFPVFMNEINKNSRRSSNTSSPMLSGNLNILRDRYERACQRETAARCKRACWDGLEEACVTRKCGKHLKRRYKKECKRQCMIVYNVNSSSESDSDDVDSDGDDDDYSD